jgi:hypothetical protein
MKVFTSFEMGNRLIKEVSKIEFNNHSKNYITDTAADLMLNGRNGIQFTTDTGATAGFVFNNPSGPSSNRAVVRPNATADNMDLGVESWAEWRNLYLKSGGKIYVGGVEFTGGGGVPTLHDHSNDTTQGGQDLAPRKVLLSTSSAARFRLPVGTNMY